MTNTNIVRVTKAVNNTSKQVDDTNYLFSTREWTIPPDIEFETLLMTYEENSIISWVIKKIASSSDVWFKTTNNKDLDKFLSSLEISSIFSDMMIFGNSFYEVLKDLTWSNTLELQKIITPTIRLASKWENTDWEKVFAYQRSKRGFTKIPFTEKELFFFKTNSIANKYYWDSIFYTVINEIILLSLIIKYYKNFFNKWNIEPKVLYDKSWKLTNEQIDKIEAMINDKLSWIDNSHTTAFVSWDIWQIDLTSRIDPDKFIALKRELKEDIAIWTNIPFSLLSPENSNRSIWENDTKTLYSDVIFPLQKVFIRQLQKQLLNQKNAKNPALSNISEDEINNISFNDVDLKNKKEEMEILTGYQKTWNLSTNEVRRSAELWDDIDWWDEYIIHANKDPNNTDNQNNLDNIKNQINKMYNQKSLWMKV